MITFKGMSRAKAKAEIIYIHAGRVERGPRYEWRDAYSENGNTYPWLTKREAQADAKRRGARAVFRGTPSLPL
jgi:hypothetical protein